MVSSRALALCALLLLASPLGATTWAVMQDGSGDFLTIGEAINAADDGDLIQIGEGTYQEVLTLTKDLILEPVPGRPLVVLDGNHTHRIMVIEDGAEVTLRHLTFANAEAPDASALFIWRQARVEVENCRFDGNHATGSNAVHVRHAGTEARFTGCSWVNNRADVHSAALSLGPLGYLEVIDSQFIDNSSQGTAGAVNCNSGTALFRGNLFLRNSGSGAGALSIEESAQAQVLKNTFIANSGSYCAVYTNASTNFFQNIVAHTDGGYGLNCFTPAAHYCNLYFNNSLGPVYGSALAPNERDEDPFFCDDGQDDFSLCSDSIAMEEANGCGDMGAYGVGCVACGTVATTSTEWGNVKSLYR